MPHDTTLDNATVQPDMLTPSLRARAQAAASLAVQYLESRQSHDGGFCFYRWQGIDEPSLRDTWHAVAALMLLDVAVPRCEETRAYLLGFRCTGFDDLYHHTLALERLGVAVEPETVERIHRLDAAVSLANAHVSITARLEQALRIVTLQRRIGAIRDAGAVTDGVRSLCHDGGWGDKPNLGDTWLALAILDACAGRVSGHAVRKFVQSLQVPSFGFTATRDSTYAHLGIACAGLRACTLLDLPVRHADAAVDFVLACQSGDGGFARTPDALPDIVLTHKGLLALVAAGVLTVPDATDWRYDSGA